MVVNKYPSLKHLSGFLLCSIIIFSFGFTVIPHRKIKEQKDNVLVVFTSKMKFEDLARIKTDMNSKGISLDYLNLEFGESGELAFIKFRVEFKDGFKGSASKKLYSEDNFGFSRDYSENSPKPFACGNLDN
jgi:hypothetical protein